MRVTPELQSRYNIIQKYNFKKMGSMSGSEEINTSVPNFNTFVLKHQPTFPWCSCILFVGFIGGWATSQPETVGIFYSYNDIFYT